MPDFYTVVTDTGLQALGLASTQGESFSLTQAVVGDGNSLAVIPNKGMTTLVNEVWRGDVSGIKVDPEDPNTFIFEFAIPADTGGFTIREVGLLNESGKLFCIGNFPDTEKPVAVNGSVRDLVVRLPLHFENADVVNLVINTAVALATKQDVTDHNTDPQAHRLATTAQTGFVRLATVEEHIAHIRKDIATTPLGVWNLLESVMSNFCASESTFKIATSNAVFQVFNRIEAHKTADDPHGVVVKVKALLSNSITSAGTTTFASSKAVKTVNDNLNAHNANPQAHRMGTEGQTGFVRLATPAEHENSFAQAKKTIAATPFGVWDLLIRVRSDAVDLATTWRFATSLAVKRVMDALNGHKSANDPHGVVAKVKALLSSSITNASSTTFATPKAVKIVNDLLNTHKATSDPHGIIARVKGLLTSSITSTSTTTFATPKAVKLVRDLVVGHTGNAMVHVPTGGATGDVLLKVGSSVKWEKLALVPAGHIYPVPFPPNELPAYHYVPNGEGLLKTSEAGKTLLAMSTAYKSAHHVTTNSTHIFLPNVFDSNGDGYFPRFVDGVNRKVGSKQADAAPNIVGSIRPNVTRTNSNSVSNSGALANTSMYKVDQYGGGSYSLNGGTLSINASRSSPVYGRDSSIEIRPKNYGFTPAIYLPPLEG